MRMFYDKKYDDYLTSFVGMVKTGESYSHEEGDGVYVDKDNYLVGVSERPRMIMNPNPGACGPMQALQYQLFPLLKKIVRGFIHSMTGQEVIAYVIENSDIDETWDSICIDGSGFDSSQFAALMRLVDNKFWNGFRFLVRRIIQHNFDQLANYSVPSNTVDEMTEIMM